MLESFVFGTIQGIAEWLPISSEAAVILANIWIFNNNLELPILIEQALFLHLGTFFSALIYFRHDVKELLRAAINYHSSPVATKKLLNFLIISTLISGLIGGALLVSLNTISNFIILSGKIITVIIGLLLIITAIFQYRSRQLGLKTDSELALTDSIILGIVQGFSALPGISRSGLTISTLLLRQFKETSALRLSFLMSLPVVLGGNIVIGLLSPPALTLNSLIGVLTAFVFGCLTINLLLRLAQHINFAHFTLFFGILTIIFSLI